ncbi:SDR family NAD(P)-dependent oxidoreductase [Franconibacter pulveris 601]|uniref:SDR family NAD(P)-dependent oxidoreductase n=1 Tax=Franconibacter pulveris TaxID=435910 RepID=UPI000467085E|nr:SDR family oxidoreductase [Franconibacter pulveris]
MTASRPTALITGASSGIGAVYADRLAARGYDLLLVARREERLHELAARLQQTYGVEVKTLRADLTQESDIQTVEATLRDTPAISLLVNNAGTAQMGSFLASSAQTHQDIITLNITALTRLTLAALTRFNAQDRGAIINIASVLALHARDTSALYSGTKGYVLNFTRGLQAEFAGTGVRLQAVLPAATATEIWEISGVSVGHLPAGSVMKTEDLVDAALAGFDAGEAITIPPLHDEALWQRYEEARLAVFSAVGTGIPAPRYVR